MKPIEQEMKASLVNDLWKELRIESMDMELQHLCFEFLKELRPGGNFPVELFASSDGHFGNHCSALSLF